MINEYYKQLSQDVTARAEAVGILKSEAFFDVSTEWLVDIGVFSEANYAQHRQTGVQIDGFAGNLADEDGAMKLILLDYSSNIEEPESLSATDLNAILKRGSNFLTRAMNRDTLNTLEESSDVYHLAKQIHDNLDKIRKIQFFLISNRILSSRVKETKLSVIGDIPITITIWDMKRFADLYEQGSEREPLIINFEELGYQVNALPANFPGSKYPSYLSVLPGEALADMYDIYGTRLLEQNVRVFLQAKGKVNKGIQGTILDEPEMFFAYNNGITATAESITFGEVDGKILIREIHNLQIVNGGQTSASIYRMSKYSKKFWAKGQDPSLKKVFVQMKISEVPQDKTLEVVPKISRYSNSQNKVSEADFFSNHPYHVEMEKFSRKIIASPREGTLSSSKWFYERMRGQYNNEKNQYSGAKQKEFETTNPRKQMFTKTDLAKFLLPWEGKPETAALGAAKSFNKFAVDIGDKWEKNPAFCNELYFQECIAKAILFREIEKIISQQDWYQGGGERAPIVVHTLGKLAADAKEEKKTLDFNSIWKRQALSENERIAVAVVSKLVKDIIRDPEIPGMLPTEWAKRADCTNKIAIAKVDYPTGFFDSLVSLDEYRRNKSDAKKEQKFVNDVEAQALVIGQRRNFWAKVREWATSRDYLNAKEKDLLSIAINEALPTEKQAVAIISIYHNLEEKKCPHKLDYKYSLK